MSEKRKVCLENIRNMSECHIVLITPDNLNDYIHKDYEVCGRILNQDVSRSS